MSTHKALHLDHSILFEILSGYLWRLPVWHGPAVSHMQLLASFLLETHMRIFSTSHDLRSKLPATRDTFDLFASTMIHE